jgi:RNA polymerase sigma factor (sigma-70 family)
MTTQEITSQQPVEGELARKVRAAAAGDGSAVEWLVREFEPAVRATATRITRNHQDAEDVLQETWVRLLTNIQQVREPERVRAWLVTTARREALRLVRERGRICLIEDEQLTGFPDQDPGPYAEAERRDTGRWLGQALRTLPLDGSRLLTELIVEERSYQEVSARIGRPIGSLGPTRARYLRQLGDYLRPPVVPTGVEPARVAS